MIETHYHLDQLPPNRLDSLLKAWFRRGLRGIVAPSMDEQSLHRILALAWRYPGRIFPAAGLHPERDWQGEAGQRAIDQAERLCQWTEQNRGSICAIGEIGLPWYTLEGNPPEAAFQALDLFLETARRLDLPVILHGVHAMAQPCLDRLQAHGVKRAVFHWLKAPDAVAQAVAEAGYYASLTPEYTCFQRDQRLARFFPLNRLLLETDGPEPLRIGKQGVPSPLWSRQTAAALAAHRKMTLPRLQRILDGNAVELFGLPL